MSAEASGYVWRFSPYKGATLLVHAAIADTVNDQGGNEFYMRQEKLAKKARVSRKAANEALAKLEVDGYLTRIGEVDGTRGIVVWRFEFRPGEVRFDSRRPVTGGNSPGRRRGTTGARNRSLAVTGDEAPPVTQNPRGREPKEEPSAEDGAGEGDLRAEARRVTKAHFDRCTAESRPKPLLAGGKNAFLPLAKIVERILDAGYPPEAVADALWSTTTGWTLNGLACYLAKQAAGDVERSTVPAPRKPSEAESAGGIAARLYSIEDEAAEFLRDYLDDPAEVDAALDVWRDRRSAA